MSLESAELALMRIDGLGGKNDIDGARDLADGCFDDVTRGAILDRAAAKERDPKLRPIDFCKDVGGTTLTANDCEARDRENAETARALHAKEAVQGLDDAARALFAKSEQAFSEYVSAVGSFVFEVYKDGSIRESISLNAESQLKAQRAKDLAAFPRFVAKDTPPKDVEAAQHARAAAVAAVGTKTPEEKELLAKTEQAWEAYRDAEVALYEAVFGPQQGADRVEAALRVRLESRRAADTRIANP
jgi:uncharacterized protein YecT (DUF1311 family)